MIAFIEWILERLFRYEARPSPPLASPAPAPARVLTPAESAQALPVTSLTEFQLWLILSTDRYGYSYIPAAKQVCFPGDPGGYPISDTGERRVLRRVIDLGLMVERDDGVFVLTPAGHLVSQRSDELTIRRSF